MFRHPLVRIMGAKNSLKQQMGNYETQQEQIRKEQQEKLRQEAKAEEAQVEEVVADPPLVEEAAPSD